MEEERKRDKCPFKMCRCVPDCLARVGQDCVVLEWMRLTGTYLENVSKKTMDPDLLMALVADRNDPAVPVPRFSLREEK